MTDPTETPIGDQVHDDVLAEPGSPTAMAEESERAKLTGQPDITPGNAEVDTEQPVTEGAFNAVDGSERPKYGFHDGRFYATFTVKAKGGPLSGEQLAQCAGEVRLHAVNNGYRAVDNSHEAVTQTSEDGSVAQVIVSVPAETNTVRSADDVPEQRDETPES
jgi:hypothetical protein